MTWYLGATRDPMRDGGSIVPGYEPKALIHTTQGSSYAGARAAYLSSSGAPHFTVSGEGGRWQCWQHMSLDRAARALRNPSGGVETNRGNVVQIEVVGMANGVRGEDWFWAGLRALARWIEQARGVPRRSTVQWVAHPESYGTGAAQRLGGAAWREYAGWLGHQHVPENSHGDPGTFDIGRLLAGAGDHHDEEDALAGLTEQQIAAAVTTGIAEACRVVQPSGTGHPLEVLGLPARMSRDIAGDVDALRTEVAAIRELLQQHLAPDTGSGA